MDLPSSVEIFRVLHNFAVSVCTAPFPLCRDLSLVTGLEAENHVSVIATDPGKSELFPRQCRTSSLRCDGKASFPEWEERLYREFLQREMCAIQEAAKEILCVVAENWEPRGDGDAVAIAPRL